MAITDGGCPTFNTDIINVPAMGNVDKLQVRVNITHTYDSDLEFQLTHGRPQSRSPSPMADLETTSSTQYSMTMQQLPNATGRLLSRALHNPDGALSDFTGQAMNGDWTFEICDAFGTDTGTVDSWEICFSASAPDTPTPAPTNTPGGDTPTPSTRFRQPAPSASAPSSGHHCNSRSDHPSPKR